MQPQHAFITGKAGVQPRPQPSQRLRTLSCSHTAECSSSLSSNGLHLCNPCNNNALLLIYRPL